MAQDETEFDKLLREAREWEARDRARHPPFGMKDETGDEPPTPQAPKAQAQARSQSQATRVRKKGNWGWVWVLILLYFLFRHFVR